MLRILDELGLDPETVTWEDLASCFTMDINWFYDDYENDQITAANVDSICLSCPVVAACARAGKNNREEGVWGGVYWNGSGRADRVRNKHKSESTWKDIESKIGMKVPR